jgi:hypothetical protein
MTLGQLSACPHMLRAVTHKQPHEGRERLSLSPPPLLQVCDSNGSKADTIAFVDSDVMNVGEGLLEASGSDRVRVKVADFRSWNANNDATWNRLYDALRITPPTVRSPTHLRPATSERRSRPSEEPHARSVKAQRERSRPAHRQACGWSPPSPLWLFVGPCSNSRRAVDSAASNVSHRGGRRMGASEMIGHCAEGTRVPDLCGCVSLCAGARAVHGGR